MASFGRTWRVTVGELRVSAPMRVAFELERTMRHTPNKATVRLWNLTRDHQAQIEQAAAAQVIVEAGYLDDRGLAQVFRGELFRARGSGTGPTALAIRNERSGTDVITHVEARDGGSAYQQARVAQSFEAGVSATTVARACATALGVGMGNAAEAIAAASLEAGGATFPEGTVLSGQASRELTRVLAALGLRWSVQHGALQVVSRGGALQTQAVRLTPSTGLVGRPEVLTRGRVKAMALLSADLSPGRIVLLESDRVTGRYVVRAAKDGADSHTNDWASELDLAPAEAA